MDGSLELAKSLKLVNKFVKNIKDPIWKEEE
jgi:hypothetical protein